MEFAYIIIAIYTINCAIRTTLCIDELSNSNSSNITLTAESIPDTIDSSTVFIDISATSAPISLNDSENNLGDKTLANYPNISISKDVADQSKKDLNSNYVNNKTELRKNEDFFLHTASVGYNITINNSLDSQASSLWKRQVGNTYLDSRAVDKAIREAIQQADALEFDWNNGLFDLPLEGYQYSNLYSTPTAPYAKYGKAGILISLTSHILGQKLKGAASTKDIGFHLSKLNVSSTLLSTMCPLKDDLRGRECPHKYRTYDGYCNNALHKTWGMSMLPPARLLPPDYADGLNEPRKAVDGSDLPLPRLLSTQVFASDHVTDKKLTAMITTFGQFIDHDITLFPLPYGRFTPKLKCCDPEFEHPLCIPLTIPQNDSVYGLFRQKCMEMMRSLPGIYPDCKLGPRQQINQLTSFIDGSVIYGSTEQEAKSLRAFVSGRLKVQQHPLNINMKDLLPLSNATRTEECTLLLQANQIPCFLAGEERSNENLPITSMHIIWLREHNRIANELDNINRHWDDETIFQETRRIIGATLQNVIYKEFLPKVLGDTNTQKYLLDVLNLGYFTGYDEHEDPTIANAFSTAAFRFGHSLLNNDIFRVGYHRSYYSPLPLNQAFFNPKLLYGIEFPEGVDAVLRGAMTQLAQAMDPNFVSDIKHNLFKRENAFHGRDLMSINIQRGRDHGIPGYNKWREWCGYNKLYDWNEIVGNMHHFTIYKMKQFYKSPDDVDLFVGGICEKPIDGALIGPTFACIIGKQFQKLRFGDRFWYENGPQHRDVNYPFTRNQLESLRRTTLAKIICQNSDNIREIQRDVFEIPDSKNAMMQCELILELNLDQWRE